ncbi:HAD family hydrolase [Longispora albida]|uniref:HAD family hydrolase n=1 Tax=Longispora albida TaxID=203523 RepID=UPI00037715ED|nr:HAD family hydrolase [Longispora albida]
MGQITTVLFDVDETLTDYTGSARAAIIAYCAELGVPAPRLPAAAGKWLRLEGEHFPRYLAGELTFAGQRHERARAMRAALGGRGPRDPGEWFAAYLAYYEASLTRFGDVVACLDALEARGLRLGVISNNDEDYTRVKLARTGLDGRFGIVVGRDTYGVAKPDPHIFTATCAAFGVSPDETAYVGDSLTADALGATGAGLLGIWLDRAWDGESLPQFARQISTLDALGALLGDPVTGSDLSLAEGVG